MVMGTVFIIRPDLENGIISGKYLWFYISMGVMAIISVFKVFKMRKASFQPSIADYMILLFGIITLSVSYFIHSSEATTKHILLILIILLYFYFKTAFIKHKSSRYLLSLFFLLTGLIEAYWGFRQLHGYSFSYNNRFGLTGSFFNPGPYACYLSVILSCALYYLLRDWNCTSVKFKLRYRLIYLRFGISSLAFAGIASILPSTMSRASWLAGLGGCGYVFIIIHDRKQKI
jgi:hypothetical protein